MKLFKSRDFGSKDKEADATGKVCRTCGRKIGDTWTAEQDSFGWIYWCNSCHENNYIKAINSSPIARAKYYDIYGKSPEEVIKKD